MKRIINILFVFAMAWVCLPYPVMGEVPNDESTNVDVRQLTEEEVDEILQDDDYVYGREELRERREKTWWDRFKDWLRSLFKPVEIPIPDQPDIKVPDTSGISVFATIVKYLLIALFVGVVLWFIYKTWYLRPIRKKDKEIEEEDFITYEEDITQLDFEHWLADALSKKDFRKAVRLQFLNSLKLLAELKLINWKMNKTNYDYYFELAGHRSQPQFMDVTNTFEYIWYGDFAINKEHYESVAEDFTEFNATIKQHHE